MEPESGVDRVKEFGVNREIDSVAQIDSNWLEFERNVWGSWLFGVMIVVV